MATPQPITSKVFVAALVAATVPLAAWAAPATIVPPVPCTSAISDLGATVTTIGPDTIDCTWNATLQCKKGFQAKNPCSWG
jgi:hypothetical protein